MPVHPRPLYRSLTFWSGIFVMGFICWVWRDSLTHQAHANSGAYSLMNNVSVVLLHYNSDRPPAAAGSRFSSSHEAFPPELYIDGPLFPAPAFVRGSLLPGMVYDPWQVTEADDSQTGWMHFRPPEDWLLVLPHWLFLLAVALPWAGLLLWRAKRIRKAILPAPAKA